MSPNFNHRKDCSLFTNLSFKLRGNHLCILFAFYFSFMFLAIVFSYLPRFSLKRFLKTVNCLK
jgi:hypothetical protein